MLAQRVMQQSLRRTSTRAGLVPRPAASSVLNSPVHHSQTRSAASHSQHLSQADGHEILVEQRLRRPVSPHLGIYRPQITWYASAFHRITGCTVSGAFYIFGAAYAVAPAFGWHIESHALAAWMAGLPLAANLGIKAFFAAPFTFHCLNGVRHLVWDTGAAMTKGKINATGWTVVGLTAASTLALLAM